MSFILYYNDTCPDTPHMVEKLKECGIEYQPINITESMPNLKRFLLQRDHHAAFEVIKQQGAVGVPVLTDDKDMFIFQPEEINKIV